MSEIDAPAIGDEDQMIVTSVAAEQNDQGRTGRQRKAPSIFDNFVDSKSINQELKSYSSYSKKSDGKKRSSVDSAALADAKKQKSSAATVAKRIRPAAVIIVKELSLSMKEKEQLQIEESFIANCRRHDPKSRNDACPLPVGPSKPMEMITAIKRGVKECSSPLLDWSIPAAKLVGSICKVFWDGENEWFYARILNYDCGFNKHYVSVIYARFTLD